MQLNKRSESTGTGNGKKYIGFCEAKVIAVNPDAKKISELYGYEYDADKAKDPVYDGENKNKDEYAVLEFWMQAQTADKEIFRRRIMLTDKEVNSPEKTKPDGSKKPETWQYVNASGQATYVDKESNLPDWFTKFQETDPEDTETDWKKKKRINVADKEYRKAIQGEADLYEFLTKYLGKVKWSGKDEDGVYPNILIDKKRLFRNVGKYVESEFLPLIGSDYTTPVVEMLTIKTDAEGRHYQSLWEPISSTIKDGTRYTSTISVIRVAAASNSWDKNDTLSKYIKDMTTGDYACSDAYYIGVLKEWDPNDVNNPIQSTSDPIRHSDEGGDNNAPVEDTMY